MRPIILYRVMGDTEKVYTLCVVCGDNMNTNKVAGIIYEAFYRDVDSDDFICYGPGETDQFILKHVDSGKTYRIEVVEVDA